MSSATVFVAGSMSIKHLHPLVLERLSNIVSGEMSVVVGDADGADASIQAYLAKHGYLNATVYCTGEPRNNIGNWPVHVVQSDHAKGTRAFFTAKDLAMAAVADFGLMVWDTKSSGTLSNILELLTRRKKCLVFANKVKRFITVANVDQFQSDLLPLMSDGALQKAEEKLGLRNRVFKMRQSNMF